MMSDIASIRRTIELDWAAAAADKANDDRLAFHFASSIPVGGNKHACSLFISAHPEAQLVNR